MRENVRADLQSPGAATAAGEVTSQWAKLVTFGGCISRPLDHDNILSTHR